MTRNSRQFGGHSLLLFHLCCCCCCPAVEAQGIAELLSKAPNCALPCMTQAFSAGNCTLTSTATVAECLCPDIPLQSAMSTCVQLSCRLEDQARAARLETKICAAYPKESRSQEVMAVAIILPSISFPIVGLRCFSRWRAAGRLWWDDWMTIVAAVLLAGLAGIEIASAGLGFGTHFWNIELANVKKLNQLFYAVQMLYILVQVFAKISILLYLSCIFPARWFQLTVRSLIIVMLLHGLGFVLATVFQCTPVSSLWDRSLPDRTCLDVRAIWCSGAGLSLFEELTILFLPIPELIKLQINMRKKMALSLMFSLGSFACITTMIRLKYLILFSTTFDMTWDNVDIMIWSIIKEFCAITCASFLALRPLLQGCLPGSDKTAKVTTASPAQSQRSVVNVGNDKPREAPETPLADDLPLTPIDIADQMAATADGKRPVIFTRNNGTSVRSGFELRDVESGKKWHKGLE